MKSKGTNFSKKDRFEIGIEEDSGKFYLSIPVFNGLVEYEEYYEISADEFKDFSDDLDNAKELVTLCRERKADKRLIQQPGKRRGSPI